MSDKNNPPQNEENEEVEIEHRALIKEEKINLEALPVEIQDSIVKFDEKLDAYEQTNGEDETLFMELQQDDIVIADNIQTWLEDKEAAGGEEEEEEEEEQEEEEQQEQVEGSTEPTPEPNVVPQKQTSKGTPAAAATTQQPTEPVTPPAAPQQPAEPVTPPIETSQPVAQTHTPSQPAAPVTPPAPPAPKTPEQQVLAALKNDMISKDDLEKILNREADYPHEKIGSLKLEKQYMSPFYKVV